MAKAETAVRDNFPDETEAAPMLPTGLGPITARRIVMASVHFLDLKNRFMHSERKEFLLKAPKKGEVSYTSVFDSIQVIPDHSDADNPNLFHPAHVRVEAIVSDLMRTWGHMPTSMMGVQEVGVMPIKGDRITPAELAHINAKEKALCVALVEEADKIHAGVIKGAIITANHRKALEWLDSENRPWYRSIEKGHTKRSVITGARIALEAIVDGGADLIEYYTKYNLNPLDYEDTYVDAMMKANPQIRELTRQRLGMSNKVA